MQFFDGKFLEQTAARALPVLADKRRDALHGLLVVSAGCRQLLYQEAQDIELANRPEPLCDFAETPAQPRGHFRVNLQNGKDFAQPPGRHSRLVQSPRVAFVKAL